MHQYQIRLVQLLTQELSHAPRDERVANAVESILSQFILLCDFLIDGVGSDVLGNRLVELAVKDSYVPGLWQLLKAEPDDLERRRVMQRC